MSKQRYRVMRIQDLKHGNIVYDETFKRNIRLVGDAYQEGDWKGVPAWKFRYSTLHRHGASRAVAWAWRIKTVCILLVLAIRLASVVI